MRYLVALGEGDEGRAVLDVALKHAVPGRDSLLFARVIEDMKPDPAVVLLDILCDDDEQMKLEEETRKKLEVYYKDCAAAGIDCAFMVLCDDHPGNAICKAAREHHADCIVVGRRELGPLQRLLSFSTSKYCIDNADCNVIVVKKPYPEEATCNQPPQPKKVQEETKSKAKEETEPQRQGATEKPSNESHKIWTLRDPVEMQKAFNIIAPKPEQPKGIIQKVVETESEKDIEERKANLQLVRNLEEQERAERLKQMQKDNQVEVMVRREESKRDLIITRKLEEEERNRRMSDTTEEHIVHEDLKKIKELEEAERQERVRSWNEEGVKVQQLQRQESFKARKLAAEMEEQERARRIEADKQLLEKEEKQRRLERTVSLEKLHLAEEQERAERIRARFEEDVREHAVATVKSKEDRDLVCRLEDEEKERRLQEEAKAQQKRAEKSKQDLMKVKAMEEEERAWRMKAMKIQQ